MTNQEIIDKFFEGYTKKDFNIIRTVMTEDVVWTFPGQHKLAGVKKGIDQLVAFFDTMSGIMSKSRPTVEKLVVASKGNYLIECQHIKTNRDDGINIDRHVCVISRKTIVDQRKTDVEYIILKPHFCARNDHFGYSPL